VLEYANVAAFPGTGTTGKIYVALDTNKIYRWSGATYIEVSPTVGTIWGGITGTLANQTDLQSALDAKVPTARTLTINGVTYDLSVNRSWSITSMIYPSAGIAVSTGTAWGTSITDNSANWNTAYSWGNHAAAGYLLASTASSTYLTISTAASTYLTISNAASSYQPLDGDLTAIAGLAGTSGFLKKTAANTWSLDTNTYLTSYTETDPIYVASSWYTTTNNSANWNTAYSWGNHASAGYLTTSVAASTYQPLDGDLTSIAGLVGTSGFLKKTAANTWSLDTNTYLTSFTEVDPFRVTAVAVSGTNTKTITITRADASTVSTTWTDYDTDTNTYVTSAAFTAGTLTLTRNDAGTVSVSLDGRYYLATNPSGYTTNTGTVTSVAALTIGTTGTDLSSTVATGTTTAVITLNVPTASATNRGALSSTDWTTFNNKQAAISLTTTGSSGSATFSANTLNVPTYTLSGLGGQPLATNLTSLAALSYVSAAFVKMTAAGTFALDTNTYLTGNQSITLSGDVSGSGTTAITVTLANSGATAGTYNNVTVNAKGLVTGGSNVSYLTSYTETDTLASVTGRGATTTTSITALSFIKSGGTSAQFLKADGSVDSSTYLTGITSGQVTTALGYTPVTNARTLTINGTAFDLSADRSWTISAGTTLNGTGFVKASGTTITYDNSTYYLASNPSGYTSNTGTVTSVGGTGSYGGLTLSGTVTTSGNLTLGGTPTGTWPISVSGSATSATSATSSTNLWGAGGSYIASQNAGTSYSNHIQIREAGLAGAQGSNGIYAPALGFHWSGVVASNIVMEASGRIVITNNPGTSYEAFAAAAITCTSLTETSSKRYKENISSLDYSLPAILKLEPVSYNRIGESKKEIGFIAEDVELVVPEVIEYNYDGEIEGISYGRLTSVLIKAVKEQQKQIDELKNLLNSK
jgi:hypothetical protein